MNVRVHTETHTFELFLKHYTRSMERAGAEGLIMKKIFTILALIMLNGCAIQLSCGDFVSVPYHDEIICVSPDYYEIDGVRTPLTLPEAERIAEENNAFLPTADMVDAIWEYADLHLEPIPMPAGPQMTSDEYYIQHDMLIDEQIGNRSFILVAGHKKDIIQPQRNGRVTIYGWHRTNGIPIQSISNIHGEYYYDYSHGLRLVRYPS